MTERDAMYTLGQIARAIWADGKIPPSILEVVLVRPAAGLALMLKHPAARQPATYASGDLARLIDELPADLSDPPARLRVDQQGPFWLGWYHYASGLDRAGRLSPADLERAGRLLYGDRWQTDLARELQVGDRRVREWMSGARGVPAGIWADVAALLRQRNNEGLALLAEWGA